MFIPDTHEMFDLYDILEELISKESHDIGLGLGSRVDADPDFEYLLEVLFTPVEARCSYLDIWGTKKYPDIITDIKDGKFMDMSMEEFEEKRKKYDFAQPFTKESLLYREIFEKFVDPLYKYINETTSRVPISDWHDTKTGRMTGFKARSVIGGYWIQVLMDKMNH